MVVDDKLRRLEVNGALTVTLDPDIAQNESVKLVVSIVTELVLYEDCADDDVAPLATYCTAPLTSQSPAVKDIEVTLALVTVVKAMAEPEATVLEIVSPTLPALALLLVVVPTIPEVWEGVKLPVEARVVKVPTEGVVAPTVIPLIEPPVAAKAVVACAMVA